jgi:pyruvate dehydrogenase complex dehydrogenase (E1) component
MLPRNRLGVTSFGQSSDLPAAYALHGIDADAVVSAALDVIARPIRSALSGVSRTLVLEAPLPGRPRRRGGRRWR